MNGSTAPVFEQLDTNDDDKVSQDELAGLRKHLNDDSLHLVRHSLLLSCVTIHISVTSQALGTSVCTSVNGYVV